MKNKNQITKQTLIETKFRIKRYQKHLQLLENELTIDISNKNDVVKEIEYMKKKIKNEILNIHKHPIKQMSGTDTRYYTTVNNIGKPGRRIIKKNTEEEIFEELMIHYGMIEHIHTLESLFPKWIQWKQLNSESGSRTISHHIADWKRYFCKSKIIKKDITKLKKMEINEWILTTIKQSNLTKKQYDCMMTILRGIINYAIYQEILDKNILDGIKINSKVFKPMPKKTSEEAVFNKEEIAIIVNEAQKDFEKTGVNASLGIVLNFLLGLRCGELVALKESDIDGNCLRISRQEVRREYFDENMKKTSTFLTVVNHTKTNTDRMVRLTPKAQEILQLAIEHNKKNQLYDEGYIFLNVDGTRVSEDGIRCRLKKYCVHNGIKMKGTHAMRRTVLSLLLENKEVSIDDVMRFAGHSQISTTLNHYYFSMYQTTEKDKLFSKILDEICK